MGNKKAGVLSGMGPEVTSEFIRRIMAITEAEKDQDHIPLIINHNPTIPDRTEAILHKGKNPVPELKSSLELLVKAGADFIVIPCNTAHYYYEQMQKSVPVPIFHIIRETVKKSLFLKKGLKTAGLLATSATVKTGIYQKEFSAEKVKVKTLSEKLQQMVMNAIIDIKAGRNKSTAKDKMLQAGQELMNSGAEIIIVGCTEISLVVKQEDFKIPLVDSLQVLAEKTIEEAGGRK
jgi:aspartate racemase